MPRILKFKGIKLILSVQVNFYIRHGFCLTKYRPHKIAFHQNVNIRVKLTTFIYGKEHVLDRYCYCYYTNVIIVKEHCVQFIQLCQENNIHDDCFDDSVWTKVIVL